MSRRRRNKGSNGDKVHIPEILDKPFELTTPITTVTQRLGEAGFLPEERNRLREELGSVKQRVVEANNRIIRAASAEAEFLEELATSSEKRYIDTVNWHKNMGS